MLSCLLTFQAFFRADLLYRFDSISLPHPLCVGGFPGNPFENWQLCPCSNTIHHDLSVLNIIVLTLATEELAVGASDVVLELNKNMTGMAWLDWDWLHTNPTTRQCQGFTLWRLPQGLVRNDKMHSHFTEYDLQPATLLNNLYDGVLCGKISG